MKNILYSIFHNILFVDNNKYDQINTLYINKTPKFKLNSSVRQTIKLTRIYAYR